MTARPGDQPLLFELPAKVLEPAAQPEGMATLASALPSSIRLGTMSWSYPGWLGIVYAENTSPKQLSEHGLSAYSKHPLLRCVEVDRTYYEPMTHDGLRAYASQVPEDFRFVVKVHEDCVARTFPPHVRYGHRRGLVNDRYLDPAYAAAAVVQPAVEGLGTKLGAMLIQFPPQDVGEHPNAFADRLHSFLLKLPKGVTYAVELRNPDLLTKQYVETLVDAGAVHCHNIWSGMPALLAQAKGIAPKARTPLIVRWLLREGDSYEAASLRGTPFDRIVADDVTNREAVAKLVTLAASHGVEAMVLVDNKAEGCGPKSIALLAHAIAHVAK